MNLFGDSDYLEKLSSKGDPLERLELVDPLVQCRKKLVHLQLQFSFSQPLIHLTNLHQNQIAKHHNCYYQH
jgi:hypothetical protein